jgi:Protein of unknown function (DUF3443)
MMRRYGFKLGAAKLGAVRLGAVRLGAALMLPLAIFAARGPSRSLAADAAAIEVPQAASTVQSNVMKANVWAGPYGNYFNGSFTTVTICRNGTTACESISGILIDTGSSGLRIFGQANHLTLATETAPDGSTIAECVPFGTLSTWGRVAYADVKLGGEAAISKMPIQIVNPNFPVIAAACKGGPPLARSPAQVGFNGILGVGLFGADCGGACATLGPQNPSMYFKCPAGGCTVTPVADSEQVQNPVALLSVDNNGVVMKIPAVPFLGTTSVVGQLVLGINTRSNNQLGGALIYKTDDSGNIATTFNNITMDSFIDSGSNALFFNDSSLPQCNPARAPGFYCPSSLSVLGAINHGRNGSASGTIRFTVANTLGLVDTGNTVFYDLAATFNDNFFDFGLPFFLGRNVYTGINGQTTLNVVGTAPFFAY